MSNSKPNVLWIMADQHRADCIGAYGNRDVQTPNIDDLAADGVRFEQCFCASPLCTPSRYSILTGLYPHQHLGWDNQSSIPADLQTMPRELRRAGYHTAAVGKMHLSPTYLDVGFDQMTLCEQNGSGRYEDDYHAYLRTHDLIDSVDLMDQEDTYRNMASPDYWASFGAMTSNLDDEHHSTSWIGRHALSEIQGWRPERQNFLLASASSV